MVFKLNKNGNIHSKRIYNSLKNFCNSIQFKNADNDYDQWLCDCTKELT